MISGGFLDSSSRSGSGSASCLSGLGGAWTGTGSLRDPKVLLRVECDIITTRLDQERTGYQSR